MVKITNPNHKRNKPVQEFVDNNFALDRKIKEACIGLIPSFQWMLMELPRDEDKELIADFIHEWSNDGDGVPMQPNTKSGYIAALVYLVRYHGHKKAFREMTKEDIVDGYLRSLKREFADDPDEKWVSTYNTRGTKYLAFWKWCTQRDLPREERQIPPQLKGYRAVRRKSRKKTSVKQEELWTPEEHVVFLKYCENLMLACFHAIHRDVGGRPSEVLALKLGDIKIETVPSTGKKVCRFWIGDKIGGKMKRRRPASISDAIPYFNVWAHVHPARDWLEKNKKDAYLFPNSENKAKYRNVPLKADSLRQRYVRTIEEQFPKLLDRPEIPLEDKSVLKSLIYDKPHHPYLRRHEFATKNKHLPRFAFNQVMGHSPNSRMQEVYIHELDDEGVLELEIARGIRTREETISPAQIELQPKYCPICHESNKHNAKFCFSCNFTISTEGELENRQKETEALKEAEQTKKELADISARMARFERVLKGAIAGTWDLDMDNNPEERRQVDKKFRGTIWQEYYKEQEAYPIPSIDDLGESLSEPPLDSHMMNEQSHSKKEGKEGRKAAEAAAIEK